MDKITRGKTHQGRLSGLDEVLIFLGHEALCLDPSPLIVDVGFGAQAVTTYELWASVRARYPSARVLGLEVDPERVALAREQFQSNEHPGLRFELGGFDSPISDACVVRAMNVLRQYSAAEVEPAHRAWGGWLRPGGVLIEGSADAQGDRLSAHWMRREPAGDDAPALLYREALLFLIGQPPQFAPMMWRDYLPRDWRRAAAPHTAIWGFFMAWTQAWEQVRANAPSPQACFLETARALSMSCDELWWDEGLGALGALGWRPLGGVPHPAPR